MNPSSLSVSVSDPWRLKRRERVNLCGGKGTGPLDFHRRNTCFERRVRSPALQMPLGSRWSQVSWPWKNMLLKTSKFSGFRCMHARERGPQTPKVNCQIMHHRSTNKAQTKKRFEIELGLMIRNNIDFPLFSQAPFLFRSWTHHRCVGHLKVSQTSCLVFQVCARSTQAGFTDIVRTPHT